MSSLVLGYISTASDAISEASIMRVKGLKVLGNARTGCLVNAACRLWNAFSWSGPQVLTVWWDPGGGRRCQKRKGWISSRNCRILGRIVWPWHWPVGTILKWLWVWWGPSIFLLFPLSCQGIPLLQLRTCISPIWDTFLVLRSAIKPSECVHCIIPGLQNGLVDYSYRLPTSPLRYNLWRDHSWMLGK